MKKFIVTLLSATMFLGCAIAFSSCNIFAPKPELDLKDAAENLEDANYEVSYVEDVDSKGVVERLTASNEDGDYITITVYEDEEMAKIQYNLMKVQNDYYNEEQKVSKKYQLKQNKLTAEYYELLLDEYMDDLSEEEITRYREWLDDYEDGKDTERVFGISGDTVWSATKQAIEDSQN